MLRKILYIVLLLLLLVDLGYSFRQHLSQPLDGDMAGGIVPENSIKPIFRSPLGTAVFFEHKTYPNPNRYFSHLMFKEYFNSVPVWLQSFVSPIDSVYLSCAIAKTAIQLLLILLLAMVITGTKNVFRLDFMVAAVLITPFFQTNGYRGYMGIIDTSTTYTFFYALPIAVLMLYFLPFFWGYCHGQRFSKSIFVKFFLLPLALVVCLSGPLNPGIVLVFAVVIFWDWMVKKYVASNQGGAVSKMLFAIKSIPEAYWFYFIPVVLFSLYSLFLGKYNSIDIDNSVSLGRLYSKLPEGIYYQFTQKLGFPILFGILILNTFLIKKYFKTSEGRKVLNAFKIVGIFSLLYILLLPLGGYRPYRPYVLRYDTILPITLSLIFIFGVTSLFLLKQMSGKQKVWYVPVIVGILLIFTNADKPEFDKNKCEKLALKEIAESNSKIVKIHEDCDVLSWQRIVKPEDSELNAQLLFLWKITGEKKLYYYSQP